MEKITSVQNEKIKSYFKLKQKKERDITNRFLIENEHLIEEALKANIVEVLLVLDGTSHKPFENTYIVTEQILDKLSSNVSSVKMIAVCRKFELDIESDKVLLLDTIQDPGNLGTIIRTAHSFGFNKIYLSKDCADIYNDKTIRSTQGAMFFVGLHYVDLKDKINELKRKDYTILATSLHDATNLKDIKKVNKCAIILGNEGKGVKQELLDIADQKVYIEMNEFESLNVAIAAGIMMYEFK